MESKENNEERIETKGLSKEWQVNRRINSNKDAIGLGSPRMISIKKQKYKNETKWSD